MKKVVALISFTLLLPILSCSSNEIEVRPIDIVILSGQSNAVGYTSSQYIINTMGINKYNEYNIGYSNIKIAYNCFEKQYDIVPKYIPLNEHDTNELDGVKLGQGKDTSSFGIEVGIAESLHSEYSKKLLLIKFACGGSNIKDDWMEADSPMYKLMNVYVKEQLSLLENKGYIPLIKAICWMQGEADATNYFGYHDTYYENLKTFVFRIREDFSQYSNYSKIPFIDAGINNNPSIWPHWEEINNYKIKFAAEDDNNIYIDTIKAGLHTDKEPINNVDYPHYDSESEILLGQLFAKEIRRFLN